MIEIVTIDGKQFELTTEYPLTEQQRQQTISDIRRQTGCTSCNKTRSLDGSIQTLAAPCIDVVIQAPANVTVQKIEIGAVDCTDGVCSPIVCSGGGCPASMTTSVTVTFANSGDIAQEITPTLNVGPTGSEMLYNITPATVSIPPIGSNTATFTGVVLVRGPNHICATFV